MAMPGYAVVQPCSSTSQSPSLSERLRTFRLDRSRCMSRIRAKSYAVAVDTVGKLRWSSADIDGDHLISILSERVSAEYLAVLRDLGISYIVSGDTLNLARGRAGAPAAARPRAVSRVAR